MLLSAVARPFFSQRGAVGLSVRLCVRLSVSPKTIQFTSTIKMLYNCPLLPHYVFDFEMSKVKVRDGKCGNCFLTVTPPQMIWFTSRKEQHVQTPSQSGGGSCCALQILLMPIL